MPPLLASPSTLMLLSPARGRGGERGKRKLVQPPLLASPPIGGEEYESLLLLRRQPAPDQRQLEVAPGVGDLVDLSAGERLAAAADQLAAHALVEEARRGVGQHPQHGGGAAGGMELAGQRIEQAAAEPALLEV